MWLTRHGKKETAHLMQRNVITATMRRQCLQKKKDYVLLSYLLFCPKTGRRSVNSFAPPSFFAHEAKHNSETTLLPHVVTSLHSLFRYSVARALNPLNSLSTPCMFFNPCVRLNRVLGAGGVVREAGTLPCLFHFCFHLGVTFFTPGTSKCVLTDR